jgi:hypothetical protein
MPAFTVQRVRKMSFTVQGSSVETAEKGAPFVEWRVCENENEWTAARQEWSPGASEARPQRAHWWMALCSVLLLLSLTSGWLYHTTQSGLEKVATEDDGPVNADQRTENQGVNEVQLLDTTGDVSVIETDLPDAKKRSTYHQTHTFRPSKAGF